MNDEFRDTKDDILRAVATITMEEFMKKNLSENALFSNDLLEKNRNFVVKELQDLILELHFEKRAPRINLQDLKTARVYVLPLGGKNADEAVEKLKEFSFVIRKVLSKKIVMKFLPKIFFMKDESFDYAEKIENLIKQTHK